MTNEHLILAGIYSRNAHNNWLIGLRETTPDDQRAEAHRRGNLEMEAADKHLRKYGVGFNDVTDDEREMLLGSESEEHSSNAADQVDETPIDFSPLARSYVLSLVVKTVNRLALAVLIFSAGVLYGYTPNPLTADQIQHLQQLEIQQQQGAHHEQK